MTTPAAARKRAARRAAKQETPNAPEAKAPEGTPQEALVLSPLEKDALNIASAVWVVRSQGFSNDQALKIVDLTLTARMQALALKAERGMPFPFTVPDTDGGVEADGASEQTEAPLTEVEASDK
jgi:hypothetical protein